MIRAIGPRAVILPLKIVPPARSIELTDEDPPCVGRVISIGKSCCDTCGERMSPGYKEGDIVLIPHWGGQKTMIGDELYWFVRLEHIIGHWLPEAKTA